jgi:hypothetical protein
VNGKESGKLSRYGDGLRAGRPGFDAQKGQGIFLFSIGPRLALQPTQPPIQSVPGGGGGHLPGGK